MKKISENLRRPKPISAPWWTGKSKNASGHLQTILGDRFMPKAKGLGTTLHTITLADGDQLVAEYAEGDGLNANTIVGIFHGLTGSSLENNIRTLGQHFLSHGYSVILGNHRNCGPGFGLAKLPYHSGRGEDISATLAYFKNLHPAKKQVAIGFSLSGNALLTLQSKISGGATHPNLAISVNPPMNLQRTTELLSSGWNRIYEQYFLGRLKSMIFRLSRKGAIAPALPNVYQALKLRDFDHLYTAPRSGFHSAEDYYEKCSTYKALERIEHPTIILTTEDDPFVNVENFKNAPTSDQVTIHIENHGGHLGYLSRTQKMKSERWLESALLHFVEQGLG